MNLWIVCKRVDEDHYWEFCGVFDDEKKAATACKTADYFIGPANLNEELSVETVDWPGAYYPKCKEKA